MNHMRLLESTGLVRYEKLAPAALPAAQDTSAYAMAKANVGGQPASSGLLWGVLIVAIGLAGAVTIRVFTQSRR